MCHSVRLFSINFPSRFIISQVYYADIEVHLPTIFAWCTSYEINENGYLWERIELTHIKHALAFYEGTYVK